MHARCKNKNHIHYSRYGGKGIKICEEWESFDAFYKDMGDRPPGMTIDRIDGDKGYFKENCRWATSKQQANNTSWNRHVEYKGVKYTVSELSDYLGMNYQTLRSRINNGIDIDAPLRKAKTPNAKNPSKLKLQSS